VKELRNSFTPVKELEVPFKQRTLEPGGLDPGGLAAWQPGECSNTRIFLV
jgi:hypothetical protein